MDKEIRRKIIVGIFTLVGFVLLVLGIYALGSKQDMFGSSFKTYAVFSNVSGLQPGNNVRLAGIDIGTVDKIRLLTDSTVLVEMIIQEDQRQFIKKNAVVSVGSNGLMGDMLINVKHQKGGRFVIEENDTLKSEHVVEIAEMLETLSKTNDNLVSISAELVDFTKKLNNAKGPLATVLNDTVLSSDLKGAIVNVKHIASNANLMVNDLRTTIKSMTTGKGPMAALLSDSTIAQNLSSTMEKFRQTGQQAEGITTDLKVLTGKLNSNEGVVGMALSDTALVTDIQQSMQNLKGGTDKFNLLMEALKHNFLFKGYFKKQQKKALKEQTQGKAE